MKRGVREVRRVSKQVCRLLYTLDVGCFKVFILHSSQRKLTGFTGQRGFTDILQPALCCVLFLLPCLSSTLCNQRSQVKRPGVKPNYAKLCIAPPNADIVCKLCLTVTILIPGVTPNYAKLCISPSNAVLT